MTGTRRRSYEEGHRPKYLIVIDDSEECDRALYFAARRCARISATDGRLPAPCSFVANSSGVIRAKSGSCCFVAVVFFLSNIRVRFCASSRVREALRTHICPKMQLASGEGCAEDVGASFSQENLYQPRLSGFSPQTRSGAEAWRIREVMTDRLLPL